MRSYATITTHAALNYGAVLQAYALCQYLREQDKDCLVLNYVPDHVLKNYRLIETPRSIKELFVSGFQALHYQAKKRRRERFEAFRNSYIPLSGPRIPDHSALIEAANQYDTVICGSDQIWNPETHGFDEGYFLSFPQITTNRISYAASFGVDTIRDEIKPELSRRLAGFSSFASRERSGQQFIRELTGKEATMVLDPVFLLSPDHWRKLAKPVETGTPYALVYFLSNPGTSPFAIKRYASEHALQTLSIGFSPRDRKYGLTRDYSLGPQEFLGAIDSAHTILTNSFHCTAFAILMKKNFYTRISDLPGSRNDRLITLLTDLGLEDRLYYDRDAHKLDFDKPIDYSAVHQKLQCLIDSSKDYLKNI